MPITPYKPHAVVTTPDAKRLFSPLALDLAARAGSTVISLDTTQADQRMQGFGASLTDSSAYLISRLPAARRDAVLRELFARDKGGRSNGVGFSVLRLPMGASDFSSRGNYTYNDLPAGETDMEQKRFTIKPDEAYILPLLRRIRKLNPKLTLIASPWSAPAWMKTGRKMNGGWLDWPAYPAFAKYFVRFLQAYEKAGVPVQYITLQNEPRMERDSYPTMRMEPRDQARFVKDHLGPALAAAKLRTKILVWDHNWDVPEFPLEVLADEKARRYITGVAWHAYAGTPDAQDKVRRAYPNQETHFTESSGGDWAKDFGGNLRWDIENLIVGSTRYGAQTVLKWNLALDNDNGPKNGGCPNCRGIVTIDPHSSTMKPNSEYYSFGHASRFVQPGARRIGSSETRGIPNVAFRNPDGSLVWVACNSDTSTARSVTLQTKNRNSVSLTIPPGSAVTVVV